MGFVYCFQALGAAADAIIICISELYLKEQVYGSVVGSIFVKKLEMDTLE